MIKKKILKPTGAAAFLFFLAVNTGFADDAQLLNMVQEMQNSMKQMQRTIDSQNDKIERLERRPAGSGAATSVEPAATGPMSDYEFNERLSAATGGANKWLKDLSFKGDLRLRYEAFQNTNGTSSETDDRNRFRYRLRYGFEKKLSEDMKIGFSMASGESSAGTQVDPTSTNTTFDSNFNYKDVFIEKAYASYAPPILRGYGPLKNTTIILGKQDNLFEKGSSDIVWDRDVKPEGAIEKFDFALLDGSSFDLNAWATLGQFVLDEDSAVGGDANLFAHQLGWNAVVYTPFLERPVDYLGAISYYSYDGYAKNGNSAIAGTSLARGNSNVTGATGNLDVADFEVIELYNEISVYPMGVPFRPFYDIAYNGGGALSDFDQDNNTSDTAGAIGLDERTAWAFGLKVGGINKKGDWEASWAYKYIAANAVPGFNDSDFGNTGHSGKRGNVFKLGYALTDSLTLNGAAFFVENLNSGTGGVLDEQQRRFQMDLVWKF